MIAGIAVPGLLSHATAVHPPPGDGVEHRVEQSVVLVEEAPQDGDDDHRGHHRHEDHRAEGRDALDLLVDEDRQCQGETGLAGHDDEREEGRVRQGPDEGRVVGEGPDEVLDPDELRRLGEIGGCW